MDEYNAENPTIRRHVRPEKQKDKYFKVRNILNIVFIFLALLTVVLYFVFPLPDGLPYFFTCCFMALGVKTVEVCMRMSANKLKKNDERRNNQA